MHLVELSCVWLVWLALLVLAAGQLGAMAAGLYLTGSGLAAIVAHKSK